MRWFGSFGLATSVLGLIVGLVVGFGPVKTAAMNDPTRYVHAWVPPGGKRPVTGEPWSSICRNRAVGCRAAGIWQSPMSLVWRTAGEGLGAGMLFGFLVGLVGERSPRRRTRRAS